MGEPTTVRPDSALEGGGFELSVPRRALSARRREIAFDPARRLRPLGNELRRLALRAILHEPLGFRSASNGRQRRCRASLAGWGRASKASPGIGPALAAGIAS